MTPLLDYAGFRLRTAMPDADVVRLEEDFDGYIDARIKVATSRIYAQLAKRYVVPFADPPPEIAIGWCVAIVDVDAYRKRGVNTGDEQFLDVVQARKDALEEIKLAADAENGLFDLPLREDTSESGIAKATPLGTSDPSPYDWIDTQAEAIRGR